MHQRVCAHTAQAHVDVVAQYLDVAVSGRKEDGPQLQALMRAARQHAFAWVLVWKFDRFAYSVAHLLRALAEFQHLGIRFISVQDGVPGVIDQLSKDFHNWSVATRGRSSRQK